MATDYRFLPWAKRGLGRAIATPDANGIAARPRIQLGVSIAADQDGNAMAPVQGQIGLRLFGPGDVIGIDTQLIVRTDPQPFATSFEPNYLAAVDFDPPDFPWLFTPAAANAQHRLRPWLVLLVLDRERVALPRMVAGEPLPSIRVPAARTDQELPDLTDSWMWAHAQASSAANDAATLAGELAAQPLRNVSRLISPRRLQPSRSYFAALVPAFDVGVQRGLQAGPPANPNADPVLQPAWQLPAQGPAANDVRLPVYFHWEFSTGPAGDFETLARRIRTPRAYAGDASVMQSLQGLGTTPMAVDADRVLSNTAQARTLTYEGALVNATYASAPGADAVAAPKLRSIVNAPQTQLTGASLPGGRVPTVAPPIYGAWHARKHLVTNLSGRWLNDLNVDPRFRAAAGKGTAVVQANQEAFMDACWAQVGEVLRTERTLARAALALRTQRRLHSKLEKLPPQRLLAVAGPALARVGLQVQETVRGRIDKTSVPDAIVDAGLRRLTSAQRPALKAAVRRAEGTPVAVQVSGMLEQLFKASDNPQAIDPNRYVPDGVLGSASFAELELPDADGPMVSLGPIGLPGSLSAGELRALRGGQQKAQAWYDKAAGLGKPWRPKMQAQIDQGLLTEQHFVRFAQLGMAAKPAKPLSLSAVAALVQAQPEVRRSEGLLLALSPAAGQVGGAFKLDLLPLRIDARSGAIQGIGAARPVPGPAAKRAGAPVGAQPRNRVHLAVLGDVGRVDRAQLGQFNNSLVFGSLPVNSLPLALDTQAVRIGTDLQSAVPGLFAGSGAVLPPGLSTVTLPPPLRDRATLSRFEEALKAHNRLWLSPLDVAGVKVVARDFPLATAVARVRQRIDPELTVPARLATTLAVGGAALALDIGSKSLLSPHIAAVRANNALGRDLRFVMPRVLDRVMAYPKLMEPMSLRLARMDADSMMPGAQGIPNDTLLLARTNSRFVEAFMVGINHEMGRELLWRGYPTDQRGTPMRHFWDRLDDAPDIDEIHLWDPALPLGGQPPANGSPPGDKLVLVIRASLIRRFPNLAIYARRRKPGADGLAEPGDFNAVDAARGITALPATLDMIIQRPVFSGPLPPDLVYVGFDIPAGSPQQVLDAVKDWCFVLEEPMGEPRFGFDEPDSGREHPADGAKGWKDISWAQVLPPNPPRPFLRPQNLVNLANKPNWLTALSSDAHAAQVAKALLQRPFRAFFLGTQLLP
jgi:hypothetical protein